MRRILILVCLCLCALGTQLAAIAQESRLVKPGDRVNVVCEEEAALSKEYTVTRDGYVVMQFIGAQQIAGLTEQMAAAKISSELLRNRIVDKATVRLSVAGFAPAYVSFGGAVSKSGETPFREGARLSDVIGIARPTNNADLSRVSITSADGQEAIVDYARYDGKNDKNNPRLRPGDRVLFPAFGKSTEIVVVGSVARPGALTFESGMTVGQAVERSGGLSSKADSGGVIIVRGTGSIAAPMPKAESVVLEAGDSIRVPERKVISSTPAPASLAYIYVGGAVNKPQRVDYKEGLTLGQAINKSGGAKKDANLSGITITRGSGKDKKVVKGDLVAMVKGRTPDIALKAGDVINVPVAKKSRSNTDTILKVAGAVGLLFFLGIIR